MVDAYWPSVWFKYKIVLLPISLFVGVCKKKLQFCLVYDIIRYSQIFLYFNFLI